MDSSVKTIVALGWCHVAKGVLPFTIVDELIRQIRRSNLFICVLRDVYDTSVFNDNASGSFLEAEIYQAALSHNNVRFFLMERFNPPEKLKGLPDAETKQTYRQSLAKLQLSNTSRHA